MPRRKLALALGAVALLAAFFVLRRALGIELRPDTIRAAVDEMGVWAPLVFVGIVAFRIPLMVPSALILIAGGLVFGSIEGTLYGATGLVISALVLFLTSRWAGREAVEARLPARLRAPLEVAGSRAGALFIAVGTAYPISVISAYPLLAGVTGMALPVFLLAVGTGSLGRAALYTYFGSSLADADAGQLAVAGALVLAAMLAPLVFPGSRAWLLQAVERREPRR
jgi:uncharacterized membrane protein YdjX (TVP38/TMEM64 family)